MRQSITTHHGYYARRKAISIAIGLCIATQ